MKFLVSPTCNFILSIIKLKFKSYALARNVIYLRHNEENFNIKISKEFGTNLNANLKGNVLLRREREQRRRMFQYLFFPTLETLQKLCQALFYKLSLFQHNSVNRINMASNFVLGLVPMVPLSP